jgi:NitT/TauT family transport system ATP-binding protein
LSPRPGRVWKTIEPRLSRTLSPDQIRREPVYLDTVEAIWQSLKEYVE